MVQLKSDKLRNEARKITLANPPIPHRGCYSFLALLGLGSVALSLFKLDPTKIPGLKWIPLDRDQWHSILVPVLLGAVVVAVALIWLSYVAWRIDIDKAAAEWATAANAINPPNEATVEAPRISLRQCLPATIWFVVWCIGPLLLIALALVSVTLYWVP